MLNKNSLLNNSTEVTVTVVSSVIIIYKGWIALTAWRIIDHDGGIKTCLRMPQHVEQSGQGMGDKFGYSGHSRIRNNKIIE